MRCVFLDAATLGSDVSLEPLQAQVEMSFYDETDSNEKLIQYRLKGADCVITNKVKISKATLKACPSLKIILTAATGVDHIDVDSASELQIPVCNTRGYAGKSLAQHVFASILYFANQQHRYHTSVLDGSWSRQKKFCILDYSITELAGKNLGIVGFGDLGQRVALIGETFGMNVMVSASLHPNNVDETCKKNQEGPTPTRVPFQQLVQTCDFISLHCPLTKTTHHLFGTDEFRQMKPSAILINTARGNVVDTDALLQALDTQTIGGAALDVFATEPLPETHKLLEPRQNLLLTPHIAWGSQEARRRLVQELVLNLQGWMQGAIRNQVHL